MKLKMNQTKLKNGKKKLNEKTNRYKYDFQQYETIRSLSESISAGTFTTDEAEEIKAIY